MSCVIYHNGKILFNGITARLNEKGKLDASLASALETFEIDKSVVTPSDFEHTDGRTYKVIKYTIKDLPNDEPQAMDYGMNGGAVLRHRLTILLQNPYICKAVKADGATKEAYNQLFIIASTHFLGVPISRSLKKLKDTMATAFSDIQANGFASIFKVSCLRRVPAAPPPPTPTTPPPHPHPTRLPPAACIYRVHAPSLRPARQPYAHHSSPPQSAEPELLGQLQDEVEKREKLEASVGSVWTVVLKSKEEIQEMSKKVEMHGTTLQLHGKRLSEHDREFELLTERCSAAERIAAEAEKRRLSSDLAIRAELVALRAQASSHAVELDKLKICADKALRVALGAQKTADINSSKIIGTRSAIKATRDQADELKAQLERAESELIKARAASGRAEVATDKLSEALGLSKQDIELRLKKLEAETIPMLENQLAAAVRASTEAAAESRASAAVAVEAAEETGDQKLVLEALKSQHASFQQAQRALGERVRRSERQVSCRHGTPPSCHRSSPPPSLHAVCSPPDRGTASR